MGACPRDAVIRARVRLGKLMQRSAWGKPSARSCAPHVWRDLSLGGVQVSLVGDFDPEVAEQAFLEFMGTIPAREEPLPLPHVPISFNSSLPVSERHTVRHPSPPLPPLTRTPSSTAHMSRCPRCTERAASRSSTPGLRRVPVMVACRSRCVRQAAQATWCSGRASLYV